MRPQGVARPARTARPRPGASGRPWGSGSAPSALARRLAQRVLAAAGERDAPAVLQQRAGDRAADARPRAGDDRDAVRAHARGFGLWVELRVGLRDRGEQVVDAPLELRVEAHADRLDVVAHLLGARGADDRRRDVLLLQHPGEREAGHGQPRLVGQRAQLLDALEHVVAQQALDEARAARLVRRPGALRRRLPRPVLAGEHALGERREHDLARARAPCTRGSPPPRSRGRAPSTAAGWTPAARPARRRAPSPRGSAPRATRDTPM